MKRTQKNQVPELYHRGTLSQSDCCLNFSYKVTGKGQLVLRPKEGTAISSVYIKGAINKLWPGLTSVFYFMKVSFYL